ncbi:zeta toxin family protein, partial [Aeromicrobium sp. CF3.5]|uniref:zeta toxin family protein n=1 Tax=Aeromicrobium sp. CF3.5 TaxID=3373078 RepID=UPI003EE4B2C7
MATVRDLSKPGKPLSVAAPTRTLANPAWWIGGDPTPSRDALHERLLQEYRGNVPEPGEEGRAIVLAGPPGAGKGRIRDGLLVAEAGSYLVVDADEFKRLLLREAQRDGSYESWIKPAAVVDLESAGEQFFPLE